MESLTNLTNRVATSQGTSQPPTPPKKTLDKDDFLKLFLTQLKQQDPQKPQDQTQFMAQLAQFSQLEQITNMTKAQDAVVNNTQLAAASTMLGKTIDVRDTDGSVYSGKVSAVRIVKGAPQLMIGLREFEMKNLIQVR